MMPVTVQEFHSQVEYARILLRGEPMQLVMWQSPCEPAYSYLVPSGPVTLCSSMWVQVAPSVRRPMPSPRLERCLASKSMPRVDESLELMNCTKPAVMAPGSCGLIEL